MKKIIAICALGFFALSCGQKKADESNLITIVDIGKNDRIELGKQLRIINHNSPKVIGMDFLLVPDSLGKDSILVKELSKVNNVVQVVALHDYNGTVNEWDSLEVSNLKFKASFYGFSNIMTTDDSILVRELPLRQTHRDTLVPSFCYAIANNYCNVKLVYRVTGTKDVPFPSMQVDRGYTIIRKEDLMSGNFDKSNIQGKIVLMGYIGYGDDYYLDHSRRWKVNGVAIHAALINEIIDR